MPLAIVHTRATIGIDAPPVSVEVHLSHGMPSFNIVGLPEASVREAKDRVRSALVNSEFTFPAKRITVNLAPADLPKSGGRFDMAIAIGIIAASLGAPDSLQNYEFVGELALSGEIRAVKGVLPAVIAAGKNQRKLFIPVQNIAEASLVKDTEYFPVEHISQVYQHLFSEQKVTHVRTEITSALQQHNGDLADIVGQESAKRALLIAAAGGHNILFSGPPGTGKTMLANRLCSILPPLSDQQALEVASIRSISNQPFDHQNFYQRPFRHPHHTSSAPALVGGGGLPKPGEVSLAHHGVLFLDELTEFPRHVLDVLREPLEAGVVCISRAAHQASFPARFQLVAALNPSPSGDVNDGRHNADQILRYLNRISGPLLERIDLQVNVPKLGASELRQIRYQGSSMSSAMAREQVQMSRELQIKRTGKLNFELSGRDLESACALNEELEMFLEQAVTTLQLSMRSLHRILRVARTIADLANEDRVRRQDLSEALSYRALERTIAQLSRH
ncbi:MAG: YifB family Mg chelatase-like AAA ATPase [Aestuariibacter sp.]